MGSLSGLFAKRYFSSKKSHSVINIISGVSAFAVGVPVAAMIILLSVFNGFEDLVKGMYKEFDPDILIVPAEGKILPDDTTLAYKIRSVEGIDNLSFILEDNALLEYRGAQTIATLRGVDANYGNVIPIDSMITYGGYDLWYGDMPQAIVGQGIAYNLGIRLNLFDRITATVPTRGKYNPLLPIDGYNESDIFPSGVFMLDAETDSKYIIVPIEFTRELFDYYEGSSGVMIRTHHGANDQKIVQTLKKSLGDQYKVLTRYEQKASLYKIMQYEKWGIFIIILLVMIISSFSVIGSIIMLVIEKHEDIKTMSSLGAKLDFIRTIFLKEGLLISGIGALGGMVLGITICLLQMHFGFVKMPAQSFLVENYPVILKFTDIIVVSLAFLAVCYIICKATVVKILPKSITRI